MRGGRDFAVLARRHRVSSRGAPPHALALAWGQSCGPARDSAPRQSPRPEASSGRNAGAGEGARIPWRLEGDGGGRGGPVGAAQVPVVQLPQQLFVLHGESLVDFRLLLQPLLQGGLLRGKLP